jgi:hypothetical protein
VPAAGKPYDGGAGDGSALCHVNFESGWSDSGAAAAQWGTSRFDLGAFAGQDVRIEINYNADAASICEGFYVDDIAVTDATELVCDALDCQATSCPEPLLPVQGLLAAKRGSDVDLGWTVEPSARGGYRGYRAEVDKTLIPRSNRVPPPGVSLVFTTTSSALRSATDLDGILSAPPRSTLAFYQVLALCANGSVEGPH